MLKDPAFIAILAPSALAFLFTLLASAPVIAWLRARKLGQQVRDDGPQQHLSKQGTPTMGGVVIMIGVALGAAVAAWLRPAQWREVALLAGLTLAMAAVGSIDDWAKIRKGRSLGLKAREKLGLQLALAAAFAAGMIFGLQHPMTVGIPGLGAVYLGWAFPVVAVLLIAGMSNAVNLTDGLDGLAAGTTVLASFALAALAVLQGNVALAAVLASLGAACLAFLWYNCHPARVFMGDTGSLAIGAMLAGAALLLGREGLLLLVGLIYLVEMFSVIIQVISFKTTGKRVFKMSPFHHHLELSGWPETQIVARAWLCAAVLAVVAVGVA